MTDIAVIVVGYVFAVRWLVRKLEANREKLLPNLPEWLRCVLLIALCAAPFAGSVLCYDLGMMYDLCLLIPAMGVLIALVNAMIEGIAECIMMQMLLGIFTWWANWGSTKLHFEYVSDDPMGKPVSELFLFIELTIIVISTVSLGIRKNRENRENPEE